MDRNVNKITPRIAVSAVVIVVGLILFITGLCVRVPSQELTTYQFLDGEYSVIDEYVVGDAYNYIIGASLVGGEIAGAKAQKAVFISFGLLIAALGAMFMFGGKKHGRKEPAALLNADYHIESGANYAAARTAPQAEPVGYADYTDTVDMDDINDTNMNNTGENTPF